MLALVIAMLIVGILRRRAKAVEVARDAVNTMFLVGVGMTLQILVFYVWWGLTFSWYIPDMLMGFKYYIDMFQTTAFWPLIYLPVAAVLPLVALLVARIARLFGGRPAVKKATG